MAIPTRQCDTWSNPGATTTAVATHEAVRRALNADRSPLRGHDYEVFLQGSYKNDTNVRGDSDVDIVVQLNETFYGDVDSLQPGEKERWERTFPGSAPYTWHQFDADVQSALRTAFGAQSVQPQNKCILVTGGGGRLSADVVVALLLRDYVRYTINDEQFIEGIAIWPRLQGGGWIENYPKRHYEHGVVKNRRTGGAYKPAVRMFKNARNYLIDHRLLAEGLAPSYFVECLLYNVDDGCFAGRSDQIFQTVVDWFAGKQFNQFLCQNERVILFGPSAQQWSVASAVAFVNALVSLWDNWQ